ncbi:MAG: helix-turn-helix transcriptional regulator [Rhizomicrobium sp.]
MGDISDREGLLDLVYETAIDAGLWPALLERFAGLIGGHAAALRSYTVFTEVGSVVAAGLDSVDFGNRLGRFADRNPLKSQPGRLHPKARGRGGRWLPGMMRDVDWLAKDEFVRTEYYNDFYTAFDIHSDISIGLTFEDGKWTGIDAYRAQRQGPFTAADLAFCAALHPHLIRAQKLGRKLSEARAVAQSLAHIVDRSPDALFLIDRTGRVRHVNSAGEAMLARRDDLTVVGGMLIACRAESGKRLQALIGAAGSRDPQVRQGGAMALTSAATEARLSITVAPLRAERLSDDGPCVLVGVSDLDAPWRIADQQLRDLFALTVAEIRVTRWLLEGQAPREIANQLGISLNTVRSQLASIFEKTGTTGQAELSRLLVRAGGGVLQ